MAKILVVDDNPVNRAFLVTLLGYRGHSLREASDGAEALALVSTEHPDMVITDILMPTMDGYEFVRRLRSMSEIAHTPVIFCTAHFREHDAQDLARQCGVEYVLTKPCEPETVLQTVDACLGNAAPISTPEIPETFDREHLRLLTDKLTQQATELTTVNLRLEALIEIGLQLASQGQHGRLLDEFCKSVRELNSAKYAVVGITSEDGRDLERVHVSGLDLEAHPILKDPQASHTVVARLMESRRPVRMRNPGGNPQALGFHREYPPFESLLAAPIASLTQVYGWVSLFHRLGALEFSEEDERLAGILGALVGRIYENGRMYTLVQQHAAGLEQEMAERRRAEEALQLSEARYRLFFERNPLPGWLYDTSSLRFLAVNESAVRHYGYSANEFLSMTIKDIRPPEDLPALLASVTQAGRGIEHSGRWRHRKKDGTIIDVEIIAHTLPGPEPVEFVLAHDITERLRNESAIRDAWERLNLALRASRTGVWTWNVAQDRVICDAFTYEIFGLPPGTFGGTLSDLLTAIHPEDRAVLSELAEPVEAGPSDVAIEFRVIWPDGTLHHVVSRGQASYDAAGRLAGVTAVSQDITPQRMLEMQFQQAQKMEAVGQLAAGIAHDFNNVLTIVAGYCSLILAKLKTEDTMYEQLEEILSAGERAAALTKQLLAFSRKLLLQPRVVNLASTLEEMDRMLRRLVREDIQVITVIDKDLAQVKIDPSQVQQVILNLIVNARDAMPQGGKLTLELKNVELDESRARNHHDVPAGQYVVLSVSDNGVGMTPEVRARVFEPFFTTKELSQGTGLGLATVYGIVKQNGGYIWLYSEPGIGTTFRIFLPRVDEPAEIIPSREVLETVGGNETILLVEDDDQVRSLIHEILTSVGYSVIVAENGDQALRTSSQHAGTIHMLISDVVLQHEGGRETAERITAVRPGIHVLFISGYSGDAITHHGILDPNVDFLQKPFGQEVLCAKVRALLDYQRKLQRVLVIDDDPSICALLTAILGEAGFRVLTAGCGHEARATARENPIDLVITDLAMPSEDGIELIRNLRKHYPQLRIIAMSGAFGSEVIDAARLLGADATLVKPLTAATLLQCIRGLSPPRPSA